MKHLTAPEAWSRVGDVLGVPGVHVGASPELIAAALRRAAALCGPCAPRALTDLVFGPMRDLADDSVRDDIAEMLDVLVGHGDLIEVTPGEGVGGAVIYAAPPAFVQKGVGDVALLGVAGEQGSGLPPELQSQIQYRGHIRWIATATIAEQLVTLGWTSLTMKTWCRQPGIETAKALLQRYKEMLAGRPAAGSVGSIEIIRSETSVKYYKGRWGPPEGTGLFVARRPQRFGAALWCFVELFDGRVERLLDLPTSRGLRGCDEAWRLQCALDAERGKPQLFASLGGGVVGFFSPVPGWMRRRWDLVGEVGKVPRTLFSYTFPEKLLEEQLLVAREALWMGETGLE